MSIIWLRDRMNRPNPKTVQFKTPNGGVVKQTPSMTPGAMSYRKALSRTVGKDAANNFNRGRISMDKNAAEFYGDKFGQDPSSIISNLTQSQAMPNDTSGARDPFYEEQNDYDLNVDLTNPKNSKTPIYDGNFSDEKRYGDVTADGYGYSSKFKNRTPEQQARAVQHYEQLLRQNPNQDFGYNVNDPALITAQQNLGYRDVYGNWKDEADGIVRNARYGRDDEVGTGLTEEQQAPTESDPFIEAVTKVSDEYGLELNAMQDGDGIVTPDINLNNLSPEEYKTLQLNMNARGIKVEQTERGAKFTPYVDKQEAPITLGSENVASIASSFGIQNVENRTGQLNGKTVDVYRIPYDYKNNQSLNPISEIEQAYTSLGYNVSYRDGFLIVWMDDERG